MLMRWRWLAAARDLEGVGQREQALLANEARLAAREVQLEKGLSALSEAQAELQQERSRWQAAVKVLLSCTSLTPVHRHMYCMYFLFTSGLSAGQLGLIGWRHRIRAFVCGWLDAFQFLPRNLISSLGESNP